MKKPVVIILLLCTALGSRAQVTLDTIFQNLEIRQTFETTDGKSAPAQLQLNFPSKGKGSYLVDAGLLLKLNFLSFSSVTSAITGEFHRNTLIDQQQHNYQFGYNFRWFQRSARQGGLRNIITANLKYDRDVADTVSSFVTTLNWTWYNKNRHGLQLNKPGYLGPRNNKYKYTYNLTPYTGAEYQQFFAANAATRAGGIVRAVANLSAAIAVNKKYDIAHGITGPPQKAIEWYAGYTARYAAVNSTGNGEGYSKLFKTGLNYYFINSPAASVSLGGSYNLGSNPLCGLKPQQYWLVAFQLEI